MTLIISIAYDDEYKFVLVTVQGEEQEFKFDTGDVEDDFKTAKKFAKDCVENTSIIGEVSYVMSSSSCNHFVFDNKGYGWETDPELGDLIVKVW